MSENNEKLFAEFPAVSTQKWEAAIEKDLKGADYNKKLVWKTDENFIVKPYYRSEDLKGLEYLSSEPGQFPYTRGNQPENNDWNIVDHLPYTCPTEANKAAKESLTKGANAVVFNVSAIEKVEDLAKMLDGIDTKNCSIFFDTTACPIQFANILADWANTHPTDATQLQGALLMDPIMSMLQYGKFHKNQATDLGDTFAAVQRLVKLTPNFHPICIKGHVFGNCGSTLVQELAYSLNIANEYMIYATEHGMSADEAAFHLHFTFSIGNDYFMEIAKLRAARLLWATLVSQYQPKDINCTKMHMLSMASSWNKTLFDAHINILRNTTEGMSAAIGGTDAIALNPFDEAYRESDEFSRHIARNSQIIMKEESHFDKVIDPAAGSYYLENLTNSIIEQAWLLFRETETAGGIISLGLKGEIKTAVEASCQKRNINVATRRRTILGTNQYPNLTENVSEKVENLETAQFEGLQPYRGAVAFETLRLQTEKWAKANERKPKVFLFKVGNLAMRQARAGFVTNFFGCVGYEIAETSGYAKAMDGINDALASKADIVAICSADEEYMTFAPEIISEIKKYMPKCICIIAGNPTENIDALKEVGAEDFIHVRTNILESLTHYNQILLK